MGDRIRATQTELRRRGASLLVVGLSSSMQYLAGFSDEPGERLFLFCVPAQGQPLFVVPKLYEGQVRAQCGDIDAVAWADEDGPGEALAESLRRLRPQGAVLVDESLWSSFLLELETSLPKCRFAAGGDVLAALRARKDAEEVERMARAGRCADVAYEEVVKTRFEGATEMELAGRLEAAMAAAGADAPGFKTLVASGPNAALPHYRAGQRRVRPGDAVILDFGCRVGGYCSDISRTVVCGAPSAELEKAHAAVFEAQSRAVAAVRPGVRAGDVDKAARSFLEQEGWGDAFVHRTGHGIGLDVHEPPYIFAGNALPLAAGMSFSVEPGVYLPGRFGVRVEDVVVVTEDGARRMTESTRELVRVR